MDRKKASKILLAFFCASDIMYFEIQNISKSNYERGSYELGRGIKGLRRTAR